jgi:hypothetical protein
VAQGVGPEFKSWYHQKKSYFKIWKCFSHSKRLKAISLICPSAILLILSTIPAGPSRSSHRNVNEEKEGETKAEENKGLWCWPRSKDSWSSVFIYMVVLIFGKVKGISLIQLVFHALTEAKVYSVIMWSGKEDFSPMH